MEVTKEEFLTFVGGRADKDVRRRIAMALAAGRGNVCRWLREIDTAAEHPFDVDWASLGGNGIDNDAKPEKAADATESESASSGLASPATKAASRQSGKGDC